MANLFPGRAPDLLIPPRLIASVLAWFRARCILIAYLETPAGWHVWIVREAVSVG